MTEHDDRKSRFRNAVAKRWRESGRSAQVFPVSMALFLCLAAGMIGVAAYQDANFRKISSSEHFRLAEANCLLINQQATCVGDIRRDAIRHLGPRHLETYIPRL
jgi:hypothetical protein